MQVVASEGGGVEVGGYGIVDANAEDDAVGVQQAQVAGKMRATDIVGHGGPIHSDRVVAEALVAVAEPEACEGERVGRLAGDKYGKGVDLGGEVEDETVGMGIDVGGAYDTPFVELQLRNHVVVGASEYDKA